MLIDSPILDELHDEMYDIAREFAQTLLALNDKYIDDAILRISIRGRAIISAMTMFDDDDARQTEAAARVAIADATRRAIEDVLDSFFTEREN